MTTPDQSKGDRSHDEVLAGEYVLGALDAKTRRIVEERMRRDRNFAAIVRRWEENLSAFDDEYVQHKPPAHLLKRIETRVHGSPDAAREGRKAALASLWGSLVFWRSVAFAGLCAVAVIGVVRFIGAPMQPSVPLVAQMAGKDNMLSLVARYDNASGFLQVTPVATGTQTERSLELWMIEGSNPPTSLGVLPQTGEGVIEVPVDLRARIGQGVVLAVSLEAYGGSSTGAPTGPVLAAGEAGY